MTPDDDPDLQEAFARLGREQGDLAPPFGAMRERALRPAAARGAARRSGRWVAFATAAALVAVNGWRFVGDSGSAPRTVATPPAVSPQIETLLVSIEHHLEEHEALQSPIYPTDFLLTQTDLEITP